MTGIKTFLRAAPLVCAAASLVVYPASADERSFAPAADTFINSGFTDNNAGGMNWFDAGRDGVAGVRRGLIRFDLSALPPGVTVTSAVLRLKTVKVPSFAPANSTMSLHRALASWGEGTKFDALGGGNGAPAGPGEANWVSRLKGSADWTVAGAVSDAAATASASTAIGAVLGASYDWSGPGLVADVQDWVNNPAQNAGWLLRSDDEATSRTVRGFGTRENSLNTPSLIVGYTPQGPNPPPVVQINSPADGAEFNAPASVTITATASSPAPGGSVTNVQFFDGTNSLGSVASIPYSVTMNLYPGSHPLTAIAADNFGNSATSAPVTIKVNSVVIPDPFAQRVPKGTVTVELETIIDGIASPLGMTVPDDGSGRMFVFDQDGRIWVVADGKRLPTPLLDIRNRLVLLGAYDERGLLGAVAHPDFAANPLIYTYSSETNIGSADFQTGLGTTNNHQSVIAEWRIDAGNSNVVDLASRREIMRIDEPQSNHNSGAMHFGPDGFLYVTIGDGGAANDVALGHSPGGNGQDLGRILGKLIRIDVAGNNSANGKYGIPASNPFVGTPGVLPEIYAYGLRNAFTFSFDRTTGDLFLPDVGQNKVEEINIVTAGGNYGWNLREGSFWFDPSNGSIVQAPVRPPPAGMIDPIAQYDHDDGTAIIGGYVYRGSAIPALAGRYVFGDWGTFGAPSGRLFYLDSTNGVNELRIGLGDRPLDMWLKGYGQDAAGELYIFGTRWLGPSGNTGRMQKLVPAPAPVTVAGIAPSNGTNVSVSWTGGTAPYTLQERRQLGDPTWLNSAVTAQQNAIVQRSATSGFFRVGDASRLARMPFTLHATGAAERPSNTSTGQASGILVLDGNTLTFNIRYAGLSGAAGAAHIHGATNTAGNAGVLIDLAPYNGGAWSDSGTVSGVIVLTDAQKTFLMAGQTYVNFHTAAFPAGEIRGQIAPVNMQVSLSPANEVPAGTGLGNGLGNLMLVGNQLTLNVTYRGLSGPAAAAHIHGPATAFGNAGVLVDLAPYNGGGFGSSGLLTGTITLTPQQLANVIDGLTYINFHTGAKPGGEIRGQIVPHVTGVPFTTVLSGLAERPTPLTNSAFGNGGFSLEGDRLTFNLVYGGLSGPAAAAHIHGPAGTGANGGVLVDLAPFNGGSWGASGTVSGSVLLTPAQRNAVLAGQTYVNFHTAANPGGELRGQISPVAMSATLSGNNERPAVASAGSGSGTLALVRDQLSLVVVYGGLSGAATASHIHGLAGFLGSAGVQQDLVGLNGGAYGAAGSLAGTLTLSMGTLLGVVDNQTYINFHTSASPGGEIRGHIMR